MVWMSVECGYIYIFGVSFGVQEVFFHSIKMLILRKFGGPQAVPGGAKPDYWESEFYIGNPR
jgi:hypothetical protein